MSLLHRSEENPSPPTFSEKEAVVAVLFLIVTADGEIAPVEEELVIGASNRMKLLRGLSIDQFNDLVAKIRETIDASGRDAAFVAAATAVPTFLRPTVYTLAADIAFADGGIQADENVFLRKIQETFGLSDDFATRVLEVMQVKNRG